VGIFPNEASVLRLAGSVLLEVHDEWQVTERRYLSEGSMAKLYETDNDGADRKEVGTKSNELLAG
jgi:transposase-like protein